MAEEPAPEDETGLVDPYSPGALEDNHLDEATALAVVEPTQEELDAQTWQRFDEAIEVLREARGVNRAELPSHSLVEALERLCSPCCGEVCVQVTNLGGAPVLHHWTSVRGTVGELRKEVSQLTNVPLQDLGLVHVAEGCLLEPDSKKVLSYGMFNGQTVQVAMLISGLPVPDHTWDFRGAIGDVKDEHSGLMARLREGAHCTADGVQLDGEKTYVELDPWEWEGPVTFEVKVKYLSYAHQAAVFTLGRKQQDGRASDLLTIMSYTMFVVRTSLLNCPRVITKDNGMINLHSWFHMVATCQNGSLNLYINGEEVGHVPEGTAVANQLRLAMLGRSLNEANYLDGHIAYFRVWHGVALKPEMIKLLYSRS